MNVPLKKKVNLKLLAKNTDCPLKSSHFFVFRRSPVLEMWQELPVTAVIKANAVELVGER